MEIKMSQQEMKTPLERVCDEKDDLYIKIINLSKCFVEKMQLVLSDMNNINYFKNNLL